MRVVIQRVLSASVTIEGRVHGKINQGFVLLVGFCPTDTTSLVTKMVDKIIHLRIFSDDKGKMNLGIVAVQGAVLSIPQFTLYANTKEGRRPHFLEAAPPSIAIPLYNHFNETIRQAGVPLEQGVFGADMQVMLINDGPVTIILDENLEGK